MDNDDSDDDELGIIERLLLQQEEDTEAGTDTDTPQIFTFESVSVSPTTDEVTFTFSYRHKHLRRSVFYSHLRLEGFSNAYHHRERKNDPQKRQQFDAALLNIGMCILLWYWFGFACPRVVIKAGPLTPQQVKFWEDDLYSPCLVEYFYVNQMDVQAHSIKLEVLCESPPFCPPPASSSSSSLPETNHHHHHTHHHVLVPLGGGKDSIVVYETLKQQQQQQQQQVENEGKEKLKLSWCHISDGYGEYARDPFLPQVVTLSSSSSSPSSSSSSSPPPSIYHVEHSLISLPWDKIRNPTYSPTAHPWSALCCFDSVLVALMVGDVDAIAVGNERSAEYGNNVFYGGLEVNHQYDKSWPFEQKARTYIRTHLSPTLTYFSALSHLWELEIISVFVRVCVCVCPQYLSYFVSCNESEDVIMGRKENGRWCGKCAKCVCVCVLLSAVLEPERVKVEAFGGADLMRDEGLWPMLCELLGVEEGGGAAAEGDIRTQTYIQEKEEEEGEGGAGGSRKGRGKKVAKPLECVSLPEEMAWALKLTTEKWYMGKEKEKREEREMPFLLKQGLALLEKREGQDDDLLRPLLPLSEEEMEERRKAFPAWFVPIDAVEEQKYLFGKMCDK